jgi:chemotaxis signal transduction protein
MTGGVVFRVAQAQFFLPATVAIKVLPMPVVARVPGAPPELVGIALVEGETVPVVALGELDGRGSRRPAATSRSRADNRPMLVCTYVGERIGLVGLEIVATGHFDASDPESVVHDGIPAALFDVGAVVARLREGRWAV